MTPTQRTKLWLAKQGFENDICEKWIPNPAHPGGGFRKDLFGFIDIIALTSEGVLAVQSTGSAFSQHMHKLTVEKAREVDQWLRTPGTQLLLIGWRKVKKVRGGKAMVWKPRLEWITRDQLALPHHPHQETASPQPSPDTLH